jgi:hypothetical protein
MARESRAVWARRVARWTKSGLSGEEFASREGVKARTLAWWRWHLGRERAEPTQALARREPAFVEVEPVVVEAASERIEVALTNGRIVRVPMTFRDDALVRVLAAAEHR